jgi:prepilin-type N-terminal cleavage/methylation domain-containing protein
MRTRVQAGFTLIEMTIAIAVASLLILAALPSFRIWVQNTQIRTTAEGVLNGFQLARAEAVRRNANIELQLGSTSGWTAIVAGTSTAIQSRSESEGTGSAVITIAPSGATKATFNGLGRLVNNADGTASITSIKIDSSAIATADTRDLCITVSAGGVVRLCDPNVATGDTRACLPSVGQAPQPEKCMNPALPALQQRGAMMLEALIGILIFSTGILALVGMQALSIKYVSDAKYRADASFLANQIIADMWVHRPVLANYAYAGSGTVPSEISGWVASVQDALPGAASNLPIITIDTSTGAVSVTVRWRPPNADAVSNHRTVAIVSNP